MIKVHKPFKELKILTQIIDLIKCEVLIGNIGGDGSLLDLLPSLLFAVKSYRSVTVGSKSIASTKYISILIHDLCDDENQWAPKTVPFIVKTLNELNLTEKENEQGTGLEIFWRNFYDVIFGQNSYNLIVFDERPFHR